MNSESELEVYLRYLKSESRRIGWLLRDVITKDDAATTLPSEKCRGRSMQTWRFCKAGNQIRGRPIVYSHEDHSNEGNRFDFKAAASEKQGLLRRRTLRGHLVTYFQAIGLRGASPYSLSHEIVASRCRSYNISSNGTTWYSLTLHTDYAPEICSAQAILEARTFQNADSHLGHTIAVCKE